MNNQSSIYSETEWLFYRLSEKLCPPDQSAFPFYIPDTLVYR